MNFEKMFVKLIAPYWADRYLIVDESIIFRSVIYSAIYHNGIMTRRYTTDKLDEYLAAKPIDIDYLKPTSIFTDE